MAGGASSRDLMACPERGCPIPPVAPSQVPRPSQLTIFYSGAVSVYNDVPADKARAIMLLLATNERRNREAASMHAAPSLEARASNAPAFISRSSTVTILKPPLSSASAPPSSSPLQAPQTERKVPQLISKRTQAELPFARKASLARFLEKRKDRVQAQVAGSSEEECSSGAGKKLKLCDGETAPAE